MMCDFQVSEPVTGRPGGHMQVFGPQQPICSPEQPSLVDLHGPEELCSVEGCFFPSEVKCALKKRFHKTHGRNCPS